MEKDNSDSKKIMCGELIVGNHDSLMLYGNALQMELNEFSKSIAKIVLRSNNEFEDAIIDVSEEIEKTQKVMSKGKKANLFASKEKQYFSIIRQYNEAIGYIEKFELSLKLQQAQLIKDNKILELLEGKLHTSVENLEELIREGRNFASNSKMKKTELESFDINSWYNRLEKKIEDMEVSLVIANQSIVQIMMMKENNYLMIDKIVAILTTTIPLWRNQVLLILGIEKNQKSNQIQEKVVDMTNKQIEKNKMYFSKSKEIKNGALNVEELQDVNKKLLKVVEEIRDIENKEINIKSNLTKIITI